jgi:predicted RNase H-like HicB family nuclease
VLQLRIESERERESGRWIADVVDLPGVMVYGATCEEAIARAKALAVDVVADRPEHDEGPLTACELGEDRRPSSRGAGRRA